MNYHINKDGSRLIIRQPKGRSFEIVMNEFTEEFNFRTVEEELGVKFNWLASELRKLARQYKVRRFLITPFMFDGDVFEAAWTTRDYCDIPARLFRVHTSEAFIRDHGATKFIEAVKSAPLDLDAIW